MDNEMLPVFPWQIAHTLSRIAIQPINYRQENIEVYPT